jgi:hypothetical protein
MWRPPGSSALRKWSRARLEGTEKCRLCLAMACVGPALVAACRAGDQRNGPRQGRQRGPWSASATNVGERQANDSVRPFKVGITEQQIDRAVSSARRVGVLSRRTTFRSPPATWTRPAPTGATVGARGCRARDRGRLLRQEALPAPPLLAPVQDGRERLEVGQDQEIAATGWPRHEHARGLLEEPLLPANTLNGSATDRHREGVGRFARGRRWLRRHDGAAVVPPDVFSGKTLGIWRSLP